MGSFGGQGSRRLSSLGFGRTTLRGFGRSAKHLPRALGKYVRPMGGAFNPLKSTPNPEPPRIPEAMESLDHLLRNNRAWADGIRAKDPEFFAKLSKQQSPEYLWIGCSDSRVPANEIVDLLPGELFVHRNVANVVVHTDLNCLSVMQFAVDVLQVKHIIVCGHYGCSGVRAALRGDRVGLADNWLRHVQGVSEKHQACVQATR